jgi:uncharacterized protein (TIGR03083 family)
MVSMESGHYRQSLHADFERLVEVSRDALSRQAPTCPGWTVEDLVRHVAEVYLHKVQCMRQGVAPQPWPPNLSAEPPIELLIQAYAQLSAEFAARDPRSPAYTWHGPDQTVGFWLRRMAQETVIHRIDAELAAGEWSLAIPDELAQDGIDEVLKIFLSWASREWPEDFGDRLAEAEGQLVGVSAGSRWLLTLAPTGVTVVASADEAQAELIGSPDGVLRWLWGRAGDDVVIAEGDPAALKRLRELLKAATQ